MWVAKRLDMPWPLLARGLAYSTLPGDRAAAAARLELDWSAHGQALATLSVRSGLDLFLAAANLPRGGEVLMSAITLDDMRKIIEAHGLDAIPLDLDTDCLAPSIDDARRLLTSRTRAVVIAHLFGGRIDLHPWVAFCRDHNLVLIEDCAQAFDGPGFRGHAEADVSLFSFGPIKTATALGGALANVRDAGLLARMREEQSTWPVQRTGHYRRRILAYAALKAASSPRSYGLIRRGRRRSSASTGGGALRNFPGRDLLTEIRRQPCAALCNTLRAAITQFDERTLSRRIETAARLHELLDDIARCPGTAQRPHNHWVFPIVADHPEELLSALAREGFDAILAASMRAIAPPSDREELAAHNASAIAERLVYLPCYPELPDSEIQRLAAAVRGHFRRLANTRHNDRRSAIASVTIPDLARGQLQ